MNQPKLFSQLRMFASSRSHFLGASAIASGLVVSTNLGPSTIAGIALAEAAAQQGGDLGILNYALTLEHLENALYRALNATGLLTGQAADYARTFGAHENTHVDALTKTITQLGGTPVKEQSAYSWPVLKTEAEVIATLATVEDLGASAYLGAAPLIQNPDLLTVAVQIHTNEAEHATAFRFLAGLDPVPFAFAPPTSMADVVTAVTPFLAMPSQMPETGLVDGNGMKAIGVAGGLAAIAAGLALAKSQQREAAQQEQV